MLQPRTITDITRTIKLWSHISFPHSKAYYERLFLRVCKCKLPQQTKRRPLHPIRPGKLQCSFLSFIQCHEMIHQPTGILRKWPATWGPNCHNRRDRLDAMDAATESAEAVAESGAGEGNWIMIMAYHVIIPNEIQEENQSRIDNGWPLDVYFESFRSILALGSMQLQVSDFWCVAGLDQRICISHFNLLFCVFLPFCHKVSGSNLMVMILSGNWKTLDFRRQIIYKWAIVHSKRSNCYMILTECGCALSRRPWTQHCQWCSTPCCATSSPS